MPAYDLPTKPVWGDDYHESSKEKRRKEKREDRKEEKNLGKTTKHEKQASYSSVVSGKPSLSGFEQRLRLGLPTWEDLYRDLDFPRIPSPPAPILGKKSSSSKKHLKSAKDLPISKEKIKKSSKKDPLPIPGASAKNPPVGAFPGDDGEQPSTEKTQVRNADVHEMSKSEVELRETWEMIESRDANSEDELDEDFVIVDKFQATNRNGSGGWWK